MAHQSKGKAGADPYFLLHLSNSQGQFSVPHQSRSEDPQILESTCHARQAMCPLNGAIVAIDQKDFGFGSVYVEVGGLSKDMHDLWEVGSIVFWLEQGCWPLKTVSHSERIMNPVNVMPCSTAGHDAGLARVDQVLYVPCKATCQYLSEELDFVVKEGNQAVGRMFLRGPTWFQNYYFLGSDPI
ncbi:hypothetical protein NDU88_002630 [Pleurodeles waltl]|uniref:Uncharacterized protein n=1 Tax=Pleurodeles waltl TaxID=8319 RepID=A0AAV7NIF8_PLEWA|nr:hypothetical protein NDU88_002630 [Pleurodeles waltl]